MSSAGILNNDLLAIHKTPEANDGQIVVARIDDEVTVKRLRRTKSKHTLWLMPENDDYQPIEIDLTRQFCSIEGVSVGVIRR